MCHVLSICAFPWEVNRGKNTCKTLNKCKKKIKACQQDNKSLSRLLLDQRGKNMVSFDPAGHRPQGN